MMCIRYPPAIVRIVRKWKGVIARLRVVGVLPGAAAVFNQGKQRCAEHADVGCGAHIILNLDAECDVHRDAYRERDLQGILIVLKAEHRNGIDQVGKDGQPANQPLIVEQNAQHNADRDEPIFQQLAGGFAKRSQIPQNADHVLHDGAVSAQGERTEGEKGLRNRLSPEHTPRCFSGYAVKIRYGGQKAEEVAKKNTIHERIPSCFVCGFVDSTANDYTITGFFWQGLRRKRKGIHKNGDKGRLATSMRMGVDVYTVMDSLRCIRLLCQ